MSSTFPSGAASGPPLRARLVGFAAATVLLLGLLGGLAPTAWAQQYSGDTTGAATWNRPWVYGPSSSQPGSLSGISPSATATAYRVRQLSVPVDGSYAIRADWTGGQDGYLFLYHGSFDPQDQTSGFVLGNDDDGADRTKSRVAITLFASVDYFVVASGYSDFDAGTFMVDITGPALATFALPPPAITAIDPAAGSTTGGLRVTLTGTNLGGASRVTFDGVDATAVSALGATQVDATTPPGSAGAASVVVTTPNGTSAAYTSFTYVAPSAPPVVTSIVPSSGYTVGGTTVTITGVNLVGVTEVRLGGAVAPVITSVSQTTIVCQTPAGALGAAQVSVTSPQGTSHNGPTFTYLSSTAPNTRSSSGGSGGGGGGCAFTGAGAPATPWAALIILALLLAAWRRRRSRCSALSSFFVGGGSRLSLGLGRNDEEGGERHGRRG